MQGHSRRLFRDPLHMAIPGRYATAQGQPPTRPNSRRLRPAVQGCDPPADDQGAKSPQPVPQGLGKLIWTLAALGRDREGSETPRSGTSLRESSWQEPEGVIRHRRRADPPLEKPPRGRLPELGELMTADALHRNETCGGTSARSTDEDGEAQAGRRQLRVRGRLGTRRRPRPGTAQGGTSVFENRKLTQRSINNNVS
jgi:hypothetical protein